MNKFFLLLTFFLSNALAIKPDPLFSNCEQLYIERFKSDMKLTYHEFDQTPEKGFRLLAAKCPQQAVDLIKNYIILNNSREDSLRWHIAQLLGELGKKDEAIKYAQSTLREKSGQLLWNTYVEGYVAYWQGDSEKLKEIIVILDSAKSHKGNAMNAKLLKQFLHELKK